MACIFSAVARNRVIARLIDVTRIIVPGSRPKAHRAGTLEIFVARIAEALLSRGMGRLSPHASVAEGLEEQGGWN